MSRFNHVELGPNCPSSTTKCPTCPERKDNGCYYAKEAAMFGDEYEEEKREFAKYYRPIDKADIGNASIFEQPMEITVHSDQKDEFGLVYQCDTIEQLRNALNDLAEGDIMVGGERRISLTVIDTTGVHCTIMHN